MTLDELERQIVTALLAGDAPELAALRAQYAASRVQDREITPHGFVTYFDVSDGAPRIDRGLLHLDDLQLELAGVRTPVDVSLEIAKGTLRTLECFVYDGEFPQSPEITAAWYYGTEKHAGVTPELLAERDVEELLEDED